MTTPNARLAVSPVIKTHEEPRDPNRELFTLLVAPALLGVATGVVILVVVVLVVWGSLKILYGG